MSEKLIKNAIYGAIIGDAAGSRFEFNPHKSTEFEFFTDESRVTDDTIATLAVKDWINHGMSDYLGDYFRCWFNDFSVGTGPRFMRWLLSKKNEPYNSFGNGSAMRVSPVVMQAKSLEECKKLAVATAEVTHNHPEGILGAVVIACAAYAAKESRSKEEIKSLVKELAPQYNIDKHVEDFRETYKFDSTCQGSCAESVCAFLDSDDYESAVRLAVSCGGDADTMGAMTGTIAAMYYGIPEKFVNFIKDNLPEELINVIETDERTV